MLRLVTDANFNGDIARGLLLRQPNLDIVRVQDVGLADAADQDILTWAAENGRILLTHDRATMPGFAFDRILEGLGMAGVFVLNDRFPVSSAIEEILLLATSSDHPDWNGRVLYLPL